MTVAPVFSSALTQTPKPKDPADAAKQFEALMIGKMLSSSHASASSSLDGEGDSTEEPMWDVAAQQFALLMANHGGFGLAKLITKSLDVKAVAAK